jgi:N-acyl-D-aspartate/D-glutamate deacylase
VLDLRIAGALVVDGSGAPGRTADVAVRDGRVVAVGSEADESARRVVDGDGLVVAPGFIDPHTHYDAQLFWDPWAIPSSAHGVTTVISGNCGFSLAPLLERDAAYTRRMMAKVEGMSLGALETGVPWGWTAFGQFLDRLDGEIGLNAGFLVGHCALRRFVLGESANERAATPEELDQMTQLLDDSLAEGGLGLSTSASPTHDDGDGGPVPSRAADRREQLALCDVVRRHDGTTLEAIIEGCLRRFTDDDVELLVAMSRTAERPLNWNVLGIDATDADRPAHQLGASAVARANGARIVALTMPVLVPMTMSFGSFCALWLIPGWGAVLDVDVDERIRRLRDPKVRRQLAASADASPLSFTRLARFEHYVVGETFAAENRRYEGRRVDDLAAELGVDPFTCVVEIAARDRLRTVLWPQPANDTAADWALRRRVWDHPDVLLGGSDAGAHVDRMSGASYPTRFLADVLRGRRLLSLERAVHLMTEAPAELFGLRDRGRLEPGAHADLVMFDPDRIDATDPKTANDLPGAGLRLVSDSIGVEHVFVNGVEIRNEDGPTEARPGTLLRSGRHTRTVRTR